MVCPKCGLPEELCVCEMIAKEKQMIRIYVEKKRFGKVSTIIQGIDESRIDVKNLLKKLKSKLACGGTFKEGNIELQGDHKYKVVEILQKEGFPKDMIDVS